MAKIKGPIKLTKWLETDKWCCEIEVKDINSYKRPDQPIQRDNFLNNVIINVAKEVKNV